MLGINELLIVKRYADQFLSRNPTLVFAVLVNANGIAAKGLKGRWAELKEHLPGADGD